MLSSFQRGILDGEYTRSQLEAIARNNRAERRDSSKAVAVRVRLQRIPSKDVEGYLAYLRYDNGAPGAVLVYYEDDGVINID